MRQHAEAEAERILLNEYDKFYRLAYSYVNNEQDALDIVQESAFKVIKDCGKVHDPQYLSTWIYRVVMNTAVDFLRKHKNCSVSLEDMDIPHEDTYKEDDPMDLLKTLEETDRTILALKYFEELEFKEIAEILNMNTNTVKARLYRALKKLKFDLGPEMA